MSKHYIVNCYTCQHNGQETCKGCNTLLVGDDEPYENWQLREDLEAKDQRIVELEEQLKNAIVPKFKIGQKVWFVNEISEEIYLGVVVGFEVSKVYFSPLDIYYRIEYEDGCLITDDFEDEFVFATKEEAQAKLEELGEKK